ARSIYGDSRRTGQHGFGCRTTVTAQPHLAIASYGRDLSIIGIDFTDSRIVEICNVKIARPVNSYSLWFGEQRILCRAAIAAKTGDSASRDSRNFSVRRHFAHAVEIGIRDINSA